MNRLTSQIFKQRIAETYAYDPVDQLIQAKYGSLRTVGYQYDATGNRQTVVDGSVTTTYTANADTTGGWEASGETAAGSPKGETSGSERVNCSAYTEVGGEVVVLDANGNQAGTSGTAYTYDAQNRLTSATVNGVTTAFTYDPRNRVIARTTTRPAEPDQSAQIHHLTYERWNLIEERNAAGNLDQVYIHGSGTDDHRRLGSLGGDCRRQPEGRDERERASQLLVKITNVGSAYYHHDGLGSTIALTDETGTVVESYTYDAFGAASIYDSSFNFQPSSLSGNRFLFTGREWLAEVSLYDYRNRVYSPALGRFLQTDPIRFSAGDVNIYRYCGNNPINYSDPDGKNPIAIAGAIIGASLNAYNNYHAYKSGKMSKKNYVKSVVFGAGTGALAGFAPGILGGALAGGTMAALNNAHEQSLKGSKFNAKQIAKAGLLGLVVGATGGFGTKLGSQLYKPTYQIGKSFLRGGNGSFRNFGNVGGIVGNSIGSIGTNN